MQSRAAIEHFVYQGMTEHDVQYVVLHYLVGRPLDVICQKSTNLHSNYRRSELKMCVCYTQWLLPSHQVQDLYADIVCNQAMCDLFKAPRDVKAIRILHANLGLI